MVPLNDNYSRIDDMREEAKYLNHDKAQAANELLSKKSMNFGALIALNKLKEDHESQETIKLSTDPHENEEEEEGELAEKKKKSKKKEDQVYLKDIAKINKDIEKIKSKAKIK